MASAFYAMAALSSLALLLVLFQDAGLESRQQDRPPQALRSALVSMLRRQRTRGILLARMSTMIINGAELTSPAPAHAPVVRGQRQADRRGHRACRTLVNALLQTPGGRLADRHDKVLLLRVGCVIIAGA